MKTNFENNKLTIFLEGRIDARNSSETEAEIFAELSKNPGASEVVIDAEKLEYISSAGLRVLLKVRKQINKPLPILNVSSEVFEIFNVTGFTELLDVHKKLREISVEGCEVIGSGGYGSVYRIDPETIVKIYRPEISLEFVEQERNISQKAFLMGVPTAISYDVVKCENHYGVVYEMLNARTVAQIISEDPSKIPELCGSAAELLKSLHKIVPGADAGLLSRKKQLLSWHASVSKLITEAEAEKIKNFILSIPDSNTFLHGDYNSRNIMVRDGEFQLIDIGAAATGHPMFDIVGLMLSYIILPNTKSDKITDEQRRALLGFDFQYASQVWNVMCGKYFNLSSPEEIEAVTKKLMPYCYLVMAWHSFLYMPNRKDMSDIIEMIVRSRLLSAIDTAEPLNFFDNLCA